jgi:dihydroorotate dehydrogenase electron transfer subunit
VGLYKAKVLNQTKIKEDIYVMSMEARYIARESRPGQFLHLRVSNGIDPLLRRPFSIHQVDREKGTIEIIYRVVGRGSKLMQRASEGDIIDLMGPLGRGFDLEGSFEKALIVAGGMGIAPVFFLIRELLDSGKKAKLLWGVREANEIFSLTKLKISGVDVELATEDGSLGHKGVVTDLLRFFLEDNKGDRSYRGFVCGPQGMLKEIQSIAYQGVFDWQASFEQRMACGAGVCMGCGVKMKEGGYKMVCSDGPVFDLNGVVLDG